MDAMGQAFRDYLDGDKNARIVVHADVGAPEPTAASYFFRSFEKMPELEKKALDLCRGKVLDIGAGTGIHALELVKRGFDVLPIDRSELSVSVMQDLGLENAQTADIYNFHGGPYDTLLMMMNGIGLTQTIKGLHRFLKHAKTLLAPDGQIIMDSSDIKYMYEEDDGSYRFDLRRGYYGEVLFWVEYKGQMCAPFYWLYIDHKKLEKEAAQCGFETHIEHLKDNGHYLARLTLVQ